MTDADVLMTDDAVSKTAGQPCNGYDVGVSDLSSVLASQPEAGSSKRDIATEAYQEALSYLERELGGGAKAQSWLRLARETSLHDLLQTASWIRGLSRRILHYGHALDVLAQHHPEHVTLVWGVIRFVLAGVINHENLVNQFAKTLCFIAQVLPRCELSADLYRTDEMRDAVATLYAHILLFLKQAVKWYNVGPAGRALTALFKPFELGYKEILDQIVLCAKSIDDIASLASKVELREIKLLLHKENARLAALERNLHDMQVRFGRDHEALSAAVGSVLRVVNCDTLKINEIHQDVKATAPRIIDIHLNQILSALRPDHSPESALERHRSLVRRCSSPWRVQTQAPQILRTVGDWIVSPRSSLLVLHAQPRARASVRAVTTEFISQLRPHSKILWHLPTPTTMTTTTTTTTTTATEILKSLLFQALNQAPELAVAASGQPNLISTSTAVPRLNLSAAELQHAPRTGRGWANLLCRVLQTLGRPCFLVVDAEDLFGGRRHRSTLGEGEEREEVGEKEEEEIEKGERGEAGEGEEEVHKEEEEDEDEGDRLIRLLLGLLERFEGAESVVKLLVVDYQNEWRAKLGRAQRTQARVLVVNREAPVPPPRRKPGAAKSSFRGTEWGRLVRMR
ncbi:hypothetical protein VTG60DRAFT_4798 [Thermothelomyces hinnuleus]